MGDAESMVHEDGEPHHYGGISQYSSLMLDGNESGTGSPWQASTPTSTRHLAASAAQPLNHSASHTPEDSFVECPLSGQAWQRLDVMEARTVRKVLFGAPQDFSPAW